MTETEKKAGEFDWEKSQETLDFFQEKDEPLFTEKVEEVEVEKKEPKEKEEEKLEGEEFFKEPVKNVKLEEQEFSMTNYVSLLKDRGLIEFELEDGTELSEDLAGEIFEESLDVKIETRVTEMLKDLPEEVQNLNKFVLKGGNPQEYFDSLLKMRSSGMSEDLDLEDEDNQEMIVRQNFKDEGYETDDIDSLVNTMKESGRIKKVAETHFNKWLKNTKAERANLVIKKAAEVETEKQESKNYKSALVTLLADDKVFESFTLSAKDKLEIPSYISEKTVKMSNNVSITQIQKDLYEALRDKTKVIKLAKILRDNFELGSITKKAEDKVARSVRSNIQRSQSLTPTKSASTKSRQSLADIVLRE